MLLSVFAQGMPTHILRSSNCFGTCNSKQKQGQKFYLSEVITCWLKVVFIVPVKTARWRAKSKMCSPPHPAWIGAVHKSWEDGVRTVQTLLKMHPPTLLRMLKVGLWPCTWVKCGLLVSENTSDQNAHVRTRSMHPRTWSGLRATCRHMLICAFVLWGKWYHWHCHRCISGLLAGVLLMTNIRCTLPGISQWLG